MSLESRARMILTGKTEELAEKNLFQYHFVHHKYHVDRRGREPGLPRREAGD
jgi:hypothetical protein